MTSRFAVSSTVLVLGALLGPTASAQQVTKKEVAGISTFAQLESTIACGGSTKPEAIREIRNMGFKSVINLRLASEEGAMVEEEGAVVKAAGMNYVHLPFNAQSPDPKLIDNFIAAVTAPSNTPAYVHCAAGGRAAALWMIKRVKADGWTVDRALVEANALGLNDRFRPFALNYLQTHP
ncbi:MAG: beta-lactamase hydrolase domain-containing protein [Vicinamibacterales bacterium]